MNEDGKGVAVNLSRESDRCGIRCSIMVLQPCLISTSGEMYFERCGLILPFHPLAVHEPLRQVKVGRGIPFNPNNNRARERSRLAILLVSAIRNMLLEMSTRSYAGIPLPY